MNRLLLTSLVALTLLALAACQNEFRKPADLRLYVFDCGSLTAADISSFGISNEQTDVRELFVPCYLIEHPAGRLIFDLGLPEAAAGAGEVTEPGFVMRYEQSLVDQLADMGVAPSDIDWLSYSHSHFDHVGSANRFARATLLIQDSEYDAAFNHAADYPEGLFVAELYDALRTSNKQILTGDHDVFGDGRVRLIDAPGHTPGHQVLWIDLHNFGPLVLSGDLYHFELSRSLKAVPLFNTDREQSLRSMEKVETLVQKTGAHFWIEHNKALADTLRKAPNYYD